MFGCNDNPSARQFESAWRKLLGQHQITASESANCMNNDVKYLSVLNISSRKGKNQSNNVANETHSDECNMEEDPVFRAIVIDDDDNATLESLEENVASYLAAVLEKCIMEGRWYDPIKCKKCLLVFAENEIVDDDFVYLKMRSSKLFPPARSTVQICKSTEISMKKFNYEPGHDISSDVLRDMHLDNLFRFSDFETHEESGHKERLVKLIIEMYIKKKQEYVAKCNTIEAHGVPIRNALKKLIHFKGQ